MWQKARIIDPDFLPVSNIGREIWVEDRPFVARFHVLKHTETQTLAEKNTDIPEFAGRWMLTNLLLSNGQRARVWLESIELLAEIRETAPLCDINTGVVLNDNKHE